MTASVTCTSNSPAETAALAARLAARCRAGDCLLLRGELGAGKTAFSRGFIQSLCDAPEVVSPTFLLAQSYPARRGGIIWHFDLYRLKSPAEMEEIGLTEALEGNIALIEWPDIALAWLPKTALDVSFTIGDTGEQRILTFAGNAAVWTQRLNGL